MSPWTVKDRRRRNYARLLVMLAMGIAIVGVMGSAQATPESEDAEAVGNALESFADRLASASDALGEYQDLAENLPLTELAPGDPDALDLSNLLDDYFTPANLGTFTSMNDLASAVDGLDGSVGGVTVQFGSGAFTQPAVSATATSLTVPIHATRAVSQPLDFAFGPVDMAGGSLDLDFELDTTLAFTVNPAAITDADTAPATAVSVAPPVINLCADATGSVGTFTARFGFTDVKVSTDDPNTGATEAATLHACANVTFQDPDGTSGITRDEWTSHALTELIQSASLVDGTTPASDPDLSATFHVDASLINGDAFTDVEPADASITFSDVNLGDGFNEAPTPNLAALDFWDNITPGDVATGFAQFVASFSGAQTPGNAQLPFLEGTLGDVFNAAGPLVQFAHRITDADVLCGTKEGLGDGDDPTGSTAHIADGTPVYCRAKTVMTPVSDTVEWLSPNATEGDNTGDVGNAGATDPEDDTVGPTPTKNAEFVLDCGTEPTCTFDVTVTFDADPDGAGDQPVKTFTAVPKPQTAAELCRKVAAAASLGSTYCTDKLAYDADTRALSLRVTGSANPPAANVKVDFADQLRNATNLAGLERVLTNVNPTLDFDGSVDASGLGFDLTFGVILVPTLADISPGATGDDPDSVVDDTPEQLDRFFVKVDDAADQPELTLDNLTASISANMTGRIGFLEVTAGTAGAGNPFDGDGQDGAGGDPGNGFPDNTGFGLAKKQGVSDPVVRIDVNAPDAPLEVSGTPGIEDAIGLEDLLFNLDGDRLDAACNLAMTAGVGINAAVGGNPAFASGSVGVDWPSVFDTGTCTPDPSGIEVAADTDFNVNLKDFDPFPSLTGTHNGANGSDNLVDSTKDFDASYGTTDGNLLNMTLRNKTTGASCKILTLGDTTLSCSLSGGTRPGDTGNANKWKVGDEYEVEGNPFALLSVIIDNLDELVEQVDGLAPGLTERQIPVLNVNTKELVAKIQGLKATLDDLRGFPLAEVRCTLDVEGNGPAVDNAIEVLADGTAVYCRATSTITPTSVTWTGKDLVAPIAGSDLTVVGAFRPDDGNTTDPDSLPDPAEFKNTVGPTPTAAAKIIVSDNDGNAADKTLISEWRVQAEFEDAGGMHTVEFPQVAPPQSLQDLEALIEEKLGIGDPNVFKLDLLDLPAAGDAPVLEGQASGGDANTLEDSGADLSDVQQGMLLVNKADKVYCVVADIDDSADTLQCQNALPNAETFANNEDYEVVGNATKDLVVRLGAGYCAGGDAAGSIDCATDAPSTRELDPISVPLNVDLEAGLSDLVGLDTTGELELQYIAKAQLDIGIPLKLDLTPDVVVLDTTEASVEGRIIAEDVGLKANLGPLGVALGTEVVDTDYGDPEPDPDPDDPDADRGTGVLKLGAKLGITKNGGDDIGDNRTFGITDYFGDLGASFTGVEQSCADGPDFDDDACLILSTAAEPQASLTTFGDLKIKCDAQTFQTDPAAACDVTPPPGLEAFFNGQGINLTLIFQVLPKLLEDLENQLDGAARDLSIPVVGDTLDAGANIVGTFNDNVVTPFSSFAAQVSAAADPDGDGIEPGEVANRLEEFIYDGLSGVVPGFNGLGPDGAELLVDLNGDGTVTAADVVVTPQCGGDACPDGSGLGLLTDLRVTFKLGKPLFDAELPFDVGLDGFPLRLTGNVVSGGDWSVLVDFGLSKEDGPYLVASGKKSVANDPDTMKVNRPPDVPAIPEDDGDPETTDGTPAVWHDQQYLQDDGAGFGSFVEPGMTLVKLARGANPEERCTITKVEANKLWCDDFSTAGVEGITWHYDNEDDANTDRYALVALHPPNTNAPGGGGAAEVIFNADVTMGTHPTPSTCADAETDRSYLQGFSTTRCISGELAFLAVTVRDFKNGDESGSGDGVYGELSGDSAEEDEEPTRLGLAATIDIRSSGDRITFADVTSGNFSIEPAFSATANVDVRFRTGLNVGQSAGFPSVLGKLHLFWGFTAGLGDPVDVKPLDIEFDGLNLDAGEFVSSFLSPIVKSVQNITKPLQPVIQFLQAPIPVISDISEAVGQGPVTPLDLLEAISGNDLSLVRSIIQFVNFVNTLPTNGALLIELGNSAGAFSVDAARAKGSPPTVDQAGTGLNVKSAKKNIQNDFGSSSAYGDFDEVPADNRPGTFGVAGLTFPIFSDARNIFGVLLGEDQTLVHYDAGTIQATAGFGYSFPPIMAGPIPVVISLGGEFTVRGRFAIGYDTSGLRKVLEGGSGVHLIDGLFIDDLNASGEDVPEIQFVGEVYAEGAASLFIISVGVRGSLIFTTNLDLDDPAPADGKLRIEEIVSKLNNPICLFIVSGQLDIALSAFVEIDLFFFTERFTIEIVRITLLKFEVKCEPEVPNLADVEDGPDADALPDDKLVLNTGPRTANRNIGETVEDEKFVIRQMESYGPESPEHNGQTRFTISAFGITEDEFLTTADVTNTDMTKRAQVTGTADPDTEDENGDDTFSFIAGGQGGASGAPANANSTVPFQPVVVFNGGPENDEITTGDANDDVSGGGGNDKISTGKGVDKVRGGDGDDTIDVGDANDTDVEGGDGADTISGGPGADELEGQNGDDNLGGAGGPAANDGGDTLIGGNGNDTLAGVTGNDILIGDFDDACSDNTLNTDVDGANGANLDERDALDGGEGDDDLFGGPEDDQLDGGNGEDLLCGNRQNDQIRGGAGKDTAEGGAHDDNITGGSDGTTGTDTGQANGDVLKGDGGRDYILGDDGTLTPPNGDTAAIPLVALLGTWSGNDLIEGGDGNDTLYGQGGLDRIKGGSNDDTMYGSLGNDTMQGDGHADTMFGDEGEDTMYGSDEFPEALDQNLDGTGTVAGNDGNDIMRGGLGLDLMFGDEQDDQMFGDNDVDTMYGGSGDDQMRGGGGDDDMEGNANTTEALPADADPLDGSGDGDLIYGDAGQDDLTGGSSVDDADADGGDTILGNAAQDVIIGDNGDITRPGGTDPDGTTTRAIDLETSTAGGGDNIEGNDENDDAYGGGGDDEVNGNAGDDYVEGNGGGDDLFGDGNQDDLVGGTSPAAEDGSATGGGEADGDDTIQGNAGHDVIAGDNASINRAAGSDCLPAEDSNVSFGYDCNDFSGAVQDAVIRGIVIYDVYTSGQTPDGSLSGGDTINGNDGHDIVYAGGEVDTVHGDGGDDFVFGNAGDDILSGDAGQDDLIGGTGRTDSSSPTSAVDGRLDGADVIHGNEEFDAIAGDNARMIRVTDDGDGAESDNTGAWVANTFNAAVARTIALLDVGDTGPTSPAQAGTSGNDTLFGDEADDTVYGQGGNDGVSGGGGDDILEGNANGTGDAPATQGGDPAFAGDQIHGNDNADDVVGGTGRIWEIDQTAADGDAASFLAEQDPASGIDGRLDGGDWIAGDAGGDAIAGDNTVVERALTAGGAWIQDDLSADALDVIRRIFRERDVATTANLVPLNDGTSGGDTIYGNDGVDVAYGQGGEDAIEGNAHDDHLEGNAADDTIEGNEGQDDIIGGTGRTFSNDEATAVAGRIDNPTTDDAANDVLHGGDGLGGVVSADDDVVLGDNGTVDRELGIPIPTPDKLPFNGTWVEASWDEPSIKRAVRLLDVATTANTAPETNGTNGADTINGEAHEDVIFGQGGNDAVTGDDADLGAASAADAHPGDDYIEGNGAVDTIRGDLGQDDITGGGSAANGVLDEDRNGRFDDNRSGETLRDAGDTIEGDSGVGSVGAGDVVAGDNARIQRKLDNAGDWRLDTARGTRLRDVVLFDIRLVGAQVEPALGNADPGESGADTIDGNGDNDILLGQDNGQADTIDANAYGTESGAAGTPNCQDATGGPGSGTLAGTEEAPNGDNDDDDLPDLNDPQCRVAAPGDTIHGEGGQDYVEGNSGSDNLQGNDGEDDVVGGSSANTGHLNVILPPGDRDDGFAPTALTEAATPSNLNDGHDVIEGNEEDDTVLGDNGFVDRYLTPASGAWIAIAGAGHIGAGELPVPHPEPAKAPFEPSDLVRRDVTTKPSKEDAGAFGNDYVRGGVGQDDVYGTLGNDWLEGNENEDAIVGDMGKIVDNVLGLDDPIDPVDPPEQFITPQQPFLGATINQTGVLKREVTLYAFNQSLATAGIGHDVALGGDGNDWIHTGPGEDLANGNAGDDRLFLGDNATAVTAFKNAAASRLAHDKVDAGWGGFGYDHVWGGYGADYSDVRPRKASETPGLFPASDPETWFQVAGAGPTAGFPPPAPQELSENGVDYGHGDDNFGDKDYHYGGWDQDTLQANIGDNGPHIGDRLLDWGGSYNGYYLCPSTYGDWVSTRALAPGVVTFLQAMSQGDGATTTANAGTSGFRETAIVFTNEQKDNTKPIHADTPSHFTCGPGITDP